MPNSPTGTFILILTGSTMEEWHVKKKKKSVGTGVRAPQLETWLPLSGVWPWKYDVTPPAPVHSSAEEGRNPIPLGWHKNKRCQT